MSSLALPKSLSVGLILDSGLEILCIFFQTVQYDSVVAVANGNVFALSSSSGVFSRSSPPAFKATLNSNFDLLSKFANYVTVIRDS